MSESPGFAGGAAASASSPQRASAGRYVRAVAAGAAIAGAAALLIVQDWYRGAEALLAGDLVKALLGYPVIVARQQQTMFFAFHGTGAAHMLGLQITLGCSSVLLIAPMLLLAALLLSMRNQSAARILIATVLSAGLLVGVNLLRLLLIAALVDWWGAQGGFGWGHTLFGSLLMLAGMAAALGVFVAALGRKGPFRARAVRGSESAGL